MDLIQEIFQAIVLGLVQGITEFLPISSTAHLLVVTKAFGWTDLVGQKWFVDAIQFGSVIAVLLLLSLVNDSFRGTQLTQ
jgi:undecaprenyl-diphosphatase